MSMNQLAINYKCFNVGDRVIHKKTGQKMTVKKAGDFCSTCVKDIPEPYKDMGQIMPGDIAICINENLDYLYD